MDDIIKRIDEYFHKIANYRPFTDQNLLLQIKNFYRIDCTWSSNAIEGNSYTLSETKVLLENGLTAGGKPLQDALGTIGHAKAYDYMFTLINHKFLTENDILFMHSLLGESLENNSQKGQYRTNPVLITGSQYSTAKVSLINTFMKDLIARQNELFSTFHAVEAAIKFHKELVFIHPFADGNGRVSRLSMNALLLQRGFLPLSIPPILRNEYIQSLEKAHKNDSDLIKLMMRMELETQKDFLRLIEGSSQ